MKASLLAPLPVALTLVVSACAHGDAPRASLPPVDADAIAARVEHLSSDAFEGRAPASPGGQAASAWIADEMARIGLEPAGDDGSYFQTVPLVRSTLDVDDSFFAVTDASDAETTLAYGPQVMFWTKKIDPEVTIEDSDLVFVGYGTVAPEYGWNDYAGVDVRGKTVVMLVNDPGFATGDPDLFTGRAMTYYGRWTYKYEEAGRQGAAAAIIIHETEPASYGWDVVEGSWKGDQFDLERPDGGANRVGLEGWVTYDVAQRLFDEAGLDLEALKAAAQKPGFHPIAMTGLKASARVVTDIERMRSRNVVGVLPGTERPDEYVLLTAHWDHLGMRDVDDPDGDTIFNGAVDNATGVASILGIAESIANAPDRPKRSILTMSVTAEESGLLGADYFGERPPVPLADIVGGINLDAMIPMGRAHDMVVIGYGASELEDVLARHAAAFSKRITPDPNPEAGHFYRSDQLTLARRGVPMLYVKPGQDLLAGGPDAGAAADAEFYADRYHTPADEYDAATWDLSGIAEDMTILRDVAEDLANSDDWPNWYEGNEFRAIRDAQRADAD